MRHVREWYGIPRPSSMMEVIALFLLTLPSSWSMPAEWSQWSPVGSNLQDGDGASPDDGGDFLTNGLPGDGGGPQDGLGPAGGLGLLGGGAALATLAGIAASSGLIKMGIMKAGVATTGLFSGEFLGKDHIVYPNGRLDKGEALTNGLFKFVMGEDGNLIISHEDGRVVWSTNTVGSGSYFIFQEDGDMAVYDGGSPNKAVWNSGTGEQGGKKLVLKKTGFLVLYGSKEHHVWKSRPHTLLVNQKLHSGYSMASSNEKYKLSMQGDGNLVLYSISGDRGVATWSTGPSKFMHGYLILQEDGNLVLYDELQVVKWHSMTKGSKAQSLVLQDDGSMVLCCNQDGSAIWTNTPDNGQNSKHHEIAPEKTQLIPDNSMHQEIEQEKAVKGSLKPQGRVMNFDEMASQVISSDLSEEMKPELFRESRQYVRNGWSVWSEFTACTATCGPATKIRERTCTDPTDGETMCLGPTAQIFNCFLPSCSVEEVWSDWSDVTECSARRRTCTHQLDGGLDCLGSSQETVDCDLTYCLEVQDSSPLDGGWSVWSEFTDCTAGCGAATRRRVRTCSDPEPVNGGQMCEGLAEEIEDCNMGDCQVADGGWSDWSDLSTCTATCGQATQRRERTCTSQKQKDGALDCPGLDEETINCDLPNCGVDGGWSEWSDFGECTAQCGPATKRRVRTCSQPEPSGEGRMCQGASEESTNCNLEDC